MPILIYNFGCGGIESNLWLKRKCLRKGTKRFAKIFAKKSFFLGILVEIGQLLLFFFIIV
jgi:hypothetical protein